MAYIRFSKMPDAIGVGRTARNASFKADTLTDWCAEVEEVLSGEVEITESEHAKLTAANLAHNATIPPPPVVEVVKPPTLAEVLATELAKVRADPALNATSKAAIDTIIATARGSK